MSSRSRAKRGEVGLVLLRSGYWGIRWGRRAARERGVPPIESTGARSEREAKRVLRRRLTEVDRATTGGASPIVVGERTDVAVAEFLRAYQAGELAGRRPSDATVDLAIRLLLGQDRGLLHFAELRGRRETASIDAVVVMRWLETRAVVNAPDTIRLALYAAKRFAGFAFERVWMSREVERSIHAIRPPPASRGRARDDGVPSDAEIAALLRALRPRREGAAAYDGIAELQLRLGLRRGEVIAIQESWLDEERACVHVPCGPRFRPKDRQARTIDGVDPATFVLARDVIAKKERTPVSVVGYRQAFRRACARLAAAGTPWRYRAKTQALRAGHAMASRLAGVPLSVVALRLGHESERTTERHYLGRTGSSVPNPFRDTPLRTATRPAATQDDGELRDTTKAR